MYLFVNMYVVDYNNRIINIELYEWVCHFDQSEQLDSSISTILWSKLPFHSNILGSLMFREEAVLWEKLFLKRSNDFLKPINFYNNISNCHNYSSDSMIQESKHENSVKEIIMDILHQSLSHRMNHTHTLDMPTAPAQPNAAGDAIEVTFDCAGERSGVCGVWRCVASHICT